MVTPIEIPKIVLPHGGYAKTPVFRKSEVVYQGTVVFCRRFLAAHGDRTVDQMTQAARSCKQNIAEGSASSGTSKETELKLTNVARASLDELKEDYIDQLRRRSLEPWTAANPRSAKLKTWSRSRNDWSDYRDLLEKAPVEDFCNLMLTLIFQTSKMLDKLVAFQEEDFTRHGGIRERMHAARTAARAESWDRAIYSRLDAAGDKTALRAALNEIIAEARGSARAIAHRKGWAK